MLFSGKYEELCRTVDCIFHLAANVNLNSDYVTLKKANVMGTLETIRMASYIRLKMIHFASTTDVVEDGEPELFELRPNIPLKLSGYKQSKMVGENLIVQAQTRGIPCSIYRITNVFGDTITGFIPNNDFIALFLLSAISTKELPPMGSAKINLIPVNVLVHIFLKFIENPSPGKTFHVTNPNGHTFFSSFKVAIENCLSVTIKEVTYSKWEQNILHTSTNPLHIIWKKSETGEFPKFGSKNISFNQFKEFYSSHHLNNIAMDLQIEKVISYLSCLKKT